MKTSKRIKACITSNKTKVYIYANAVFYTAGAILYFISNNKFAYLVWSATALFWIILSVIFTTTNIRNKKTNQS